MIPISGSAYTYAYATLGELVAWIIGWDLILEYAVGNVAVAIAWSDYFTLAPARLRHRASRSGSRTATATCSSPIPERLARAAAALRPPHRHQRARASSIVAAHHLGAGDRHPGERRGQQRDGGAQAGRARALRGRGRLLRRPRQLDALRAQRLDGHPPGRGHRVLRLHRLRRRSPPRPRRRRTRSATCRVGILGSLAICTVIYVVVGAGGHRPRALHSSSRAPTPWPRAFEVARHRAGARPSSPWAR